MQCSVFFTAYEREKLTYVYTVQTNMFPFSSDSRKENFLPVSLMKLGLHGECLVDAKKKLRIRSDKCFLRAGCSLRAGGGLGHA